MLTQEALAYFWARVKKTEKCWLWTGSLFPNGYGDFRFGGRNRHALAHRLSWKIHNGEIPEGMKVCHGCDNPPCVRPDHLFLGTQKDNLQDASKKGRMDNPIARRNREALFCKKGHPFDDGNTYHRPAGGRTCRICNIEASKAYRLKNRGA